MNSWKKIWSNKNVNPKLHNPLKDLLVGNGFDVGDSNYSPETWHRRCKQIIENLNIQKESKVCEVGCGCGALLYTIHRLSNSQVYGFDYSAALISTARSLQIGLFEVSDATTNPFNSIKFTHLISHSVFQYFPSHDYAETVIREMVNSVISGGSIAILDLNDVQHESEYHHKRRATFKNPAEYDKKYRNLNHLFFNKELVLSFLTELGVKNVRVIKNSVVEYGNANLRFDVYGDL